MNCYPYGRLVVENQHLTLIDLTRGSRSQQRRQTLARYLAGELQGELRDDQISCPGPGHSDLDRSLSIKILPPPADDAFIDTLDAFIVHSFAGDDAMDCRDFVREA